VKNIFLGQPGLFVKLTLASILLLLSQVSSAQDSCRILFSPPTQKPLSPPTPSYSQTQKNEVKDEISQLEPIQLDTPTLEKGINRYWRQMPIENPEVNYVEDLRSGIVSGKYPTSAVFQRLNEMLPRLLTQAQQLLRQKSLTPRERRRLDAIKYVIDVNDRLEKQYLSSQSPNQDRKDQLQEKLAAQRKKIEEAQMKASMDQQAKQQPTSENSESEQENSGGKQSGPQKTAQQSGEAQEGQKSEQKGQQQTASQSQPQQGQHSKDAHLAKESQSAKQQSDSQQPNSQKAQSGQENSGGKQAGPQKTAQQSGETQGGQKSEQKGQQQTASQSQPQQGQHSKDAHLAKESQSAKQQSDSQQPNSQKAQSGQENSGGKQAGPQKPAQQSGEAQGGQKSEQKGQQSQGQSGQSGQKNSQPNKPGEKARNEATQTNDKHDQSAAKTAEDDTDGLPRQEESATKEQAGQREIDKSNRDKLKFKQNSNSKPNRSKTSPQQGQERGGDQDGGAEIENSVGDDLFKPKTRNQKKEPVSAENSNRKSDYMSKMLEQMRNKLKERTDPKDKKTEKDKELSGEKDKEKALNTDANTLWESLLRGSWIQSLRMYSSSRQMIDSLLSFQTFLAGSKQSSSLLTAQYDTAARQLITALEISGIRWNDTQQLGGLILRSEREHLLPVVRLLDKILDQIHEVTTLNSEESSLRQFCKNYLARNDLKDLAPDDIQYAKSFLKTQNGPLSLQNLKARYSIQGEHGQWHQLKADLLAGKLNNFLMIPHVRRYLKMIYNKTSMPTFKDEFVGNKRPMDNQEFQLEPAEDLGAWKNFYRNGPPKNDIDRLISGDLLEMTYRDPKRKNNPIQRKEKKITIILFDISGSMRQDYQRAQVQNALIAAYLDASQIEVVQGLADHSIIVIPFGSSVGQAAKLESPKRAYDYFSKIIDQPVTSDSGTNITKAIVGAYDYVIEHSKMNPGLQKANILFLTDGEDQFDVNSVINKRQQIENKIDLSFTTVNILTGNEQFRGAETDGTGLKAFGRYSYRHIDRTTIASILDSASTIKLISENASSYIPEKSPLTSFELAQFAQAAGRLNTIEFDSHEFNLYKNKLLNLTQGAPSALVKESFDWKLLIGFEPASILPESIKRMQRLSVFKFLLANLRSQNHGQDWEKMLNPDDARRILQWLSN
jgi:hypothetical protein